MSTENIDVVTEQVEAINERDWDRFRELATTDCVIHSSRGDLDIDEYVDSQQDATETLRDAEVHIDEVFAADDRVVLRYRNTGIVDGEYHGHDVEAQEYENTGIAILRVEGGQVAEVWLESDMSVRWEQVGILPDELTDL